MILGSVPVYFKTRWSARWLLVIKTGQALTGICLIPIQTFLCLSTKTQSRTLTNINFLLTVDTNQLIYISLYIHIYKNTIRKVTKNICDTLKWPAIMLVSKNLEEPTNWVSIKCIRNMLHLRVCYLLHQFYIRLVKPLCLLADKWWLVSF